MAYRDSVLGLFLAFCSSLPSLAASCDTDGPEDCQFQGTYCSWTREGNFSRYHHAPNGTNFFVGLDSGAAEGKLTSRLACSTQGQEHCLGFHYLFEMNGTVDLNVSVKFSDSEREIWTKSSSGRWEFALVPVKTSRDFSVVLHAERPAADSGDSYLVYIDDVTYWKSPCSSELPLPPSPSSPLSPSAPKSKVGLIVGIVVAVFVVIVIIVLVVFFVIRRTQHRSRKSQSANNSTSRDNQSGHGERLQRSDNPRAQSVEVFELGVSGATSAATTSTANGQRTYQFGESTDDYEVPVTQRGEGASEDTAKSNEGGTGDQVPAAFRAEGVEDAERNVKGTREQFEEGTDGYQRFTAAGATDSDRKRSLEQCGGEDSDGYLRPIALGTHKDNGRHVQNVEEDKDIYLTPTSADSGHENRQEADRFEKGSQYDQVPVTRKRNAFFVAL